MWLQNVQFKLDGEETLQNDNKKQKIAFIDLLKKQTINKNKSLHFIFFLIGAKINFQCLSLKLEIIYIEGELNEYF